MSMTIESAQSIFEDTQVANIVPDIIERFNQLKAEDQLALIWFAYYYLKLWKVKLEKTIFPER